MRTFTIVAMVFLFLFVGVQRFAQADEKAQMVPTKVEADATKVAADAEKGEADAKAEVDKEIGEVKALAEGAQGNQVKGTIERAKGTTKAGGEKVKGHAEQPKPRPE